MPKEACNGDGKRSSEKIIQENVILFSSNNFSLCDKYIPAISQLQAFNHNGDMDEKLSHGFYVNKQAMSAKSELKILVHMMSLNIVINFLPSVFCHQRPHCSHTVLLLEHLQSECK